MLNDLSLLQGLPWAGDVAKLRAEGGHLTDMHYA